MFAAETKASYSRSAVSEWSGIDGSQLEYAVKQGVLIPDVGGARKRFSLLESRMAVVTGALLPYVSAPSNLRGPIAWLREKASFPAVDLPRSLSDLVMEVEFERARRISELGAPSDFLRSSLLDRLFADRFDFVRFQGSYRTAEEFRAARLELSSMDGKDPAEIMRPFEREVDERLSIPRLWTDDDFEKIETALSLELAFRGKKFIGFSVAFSADSFAAELTNDMATVGMELEATAFVVLSISRLFRSRDTLL